LARRAKCTRQPRSCWQLCQIFTDLKKFTDRLSNKALLITLSITPTPPHTHTHTRLTALCPGLPRDSEWQWHQLGHMQVYTLLQTDNHANSPSLPVFTGRMPFLPTNQQRQSTEGISTIPPHLKYVATLSCNLPLIACLLTLTQSCVATYARSGGIFNTLYVADGPRHATILGRSSE